MSWESRFPMYFRFLQVRFVWRWQSDRFSRLFIIVIIHINLKFVQRLFWERDRWTFAEICSATSRHFFCCEQFLTIQQGAACWLLTTPKSWKTKNLVKHKWFGITPWCYCTHCNCCSLNGQLLGLSTSAILFFLPRTSI